MPAARPPRHTQSSESQHATISTPAHWLRPQAALGISNTVDNRLERPGVHAMKYAHAGERLAAPRWRCRSGSELRVHCRWRPGSTLGAPDPARTAPESPRCVLPSWTLPALASVPPTHRCDLNSRISHRPCRRPGRRARVRPQVAENPLDHCPIQDCWPASISASRSRPRPAARRIEAANQVDEALMLGW